MQQQNWHEQITNETPLLHQTDKQVQAALLDFNQIKHLQARTTPPLKALLVRKLHNHQYKGPS